MLIYKETQSREYKSIVIDSKRRGIRNSIRNLCDAFLARGKRKKRLSDIDGGAQKNKRRSSTPPRRVDLTERGRRLRARRRVSAVESIRSARSIPEANRIAVVLPPRLLRIVS